MRSMVIATDFHSLVFRDLLTLPWYLEMCQAGYLDFVECPASSLGDTFDGKMNFIYSGEIC